MQFQADTEGEVGKAISNAVFLLPTLAHYFCARTQAWLQGLVKLPSTDANLLLSALNHSSVPVRRPGLRAW